MMALHCSKPASSTGDCTGLKHPEEDDVKYWYKHPEGPKDQYMEYLWFLY